MERQKEKKKLKEKPKGKKPKKETPSLPKASSKSPKGNLLEMKKKFEKELKDRIAKLTAQKDALVKRLRDQLAEKESIIQESVKTLLETTARAEKEVAAFKEKTTQSLMELKERAESEAKKMKEELQTKTQALRGKMSELEEYRQSAENKIFELQAMVREYAAKLGLGGKERVGQVTFKGNPVTLLGQEVKAGEKAPNFQLIDNAMKTVTLDSFKGSFKVIASVPSLDTPVCDLETRRFDAEAARLPGNVVVLTVSMDLPFAQARWCAAAGIDKVKTLSDYQNHSFGLAYGVLVKELKLLARAVFIVDDQDIVRYVELVPEITKEPDYNRVLSALRGLL
jgi:thiol peroxidase